jgi:hypothetical protein
MNFIKLITAVFTALVLASGAQAAVLQSTSGPAGNTVTDFSSAGMVAFNLDLATLPGSTLTFVLEEGDLAGPLSMNAVVANLTGIPLNNFSFLLDGISFAAAGSVTPAFGSLGNVGFDAHSAVIDFASAEPAEFHFGNPFGLAGQDDWLLSTAGLRAGDSFTITAQVPEPSMLALMLPMLCAGLWMARRRRDQR